MDEKPIALSEWTPDRGTITYPPLLPSERRVVRLIAKGLFLSYHSVEWGYWNAKDGGSFDKLNKIARERVHEQCPVRMVDDGGKTERTEAGVHEAVPGETP